MNNNSPLVRLWTSDLAPNVLSFLQLSEALGVELVCTALSLRESYFKDKLTSCMNNRGLLAPIVEVYPNKSAKDVYKAVWYILRRVHREPMANLVSECFEVSDDTIRSCSSVDREEENPKNVLQRSFCQEILLRGNLMGHKVPGEETTLDNMTPMAHAQIRCGCATSSACYYCCKASPTAEVREWINMSLSRYAYFSTGRPRTRQQFQIMKKFESQGDVVVLNKFGIIPYRSYLQPHGPIYAPRRVKLQVFYGDACALDTDALDEGLYYESEEYEVKHAEGEQIFALPQPICLLTSNCVGNQAFTVRVLLIGAHQRQTFGEHTGLPHHNWYYICISQVSLYGASLQRTASILREHLTMGKQPKHANFFQRSPEAQSRTHEHLKFLDPLSKASVDIRTTKSTNKCGATRIQWIVDV